MKKTFICLIFLTIIFTNFLPFLNIAKAIEIENPLKWGSISELIEAIVKFLQEVALVITAGVIVLAGYFFVTSGGDPAKVTQAKNMVLYALIGLVIILMAQSIIALIEKVIKGK